MRSFKFLVAGAVITPALSFASQADAAYVITTWTGVVRAGADLENVFGGRGVSTPSE